MKHWSRNVLKWNTEWKICRYLCFTSKSARKKVSLSFLGVQFFSWLHRVDACARRVWQKDIALLCCHRTLLTHIHRHISNASTLWLSLRNTRFTSELGGEISLLFSFVNNENSMNFGPFLMPNVFKSIFLIFKTTVFESCTKIKYESRTSAIGMC